MTEASHEANFGVPMWLLRIIRFISDYIVEILSGIITILALFAGAFDGNLFWDGWFIVVPLIISVGLVIWGYARRQSYAQLRDQKRAAEEKSGTYFDALDRSIHALLKKILDDCGIDDMMTRASAYFYDKDPEGEHFTLVSRFSLNSQLDESQRKLERYSVSKGILGKGWIEGAGYIAVNRLDKDRDEWNRTLVEQYGYTRSEAESIKMQAITIGALRIHDTGNQEKAVGLLVIESERRDRLPAWLLEELYSSSLWKVFSQIMIAFGPLVPRGDWVAPQDLPQEVHDEASEEWEAI